MPAVGLGPGRSRASCPIPRKAAGLTPYSLHAKRLAAVYSQLFDPDNLAGSVVTGVLVMLESLRRKSPLLRSECGRFFIWCNLAEKNQRGAMNFWWVNHKQTFTSEISGGYIWSPRRKSNGGFNQTYENLRLVQPGDTVISYADGQVKAIGVATSTYRDEVKPEDFGKAGDAWHAEGWLVPINWTLFEQSLRPREHLDQIAQSCPGSTRLCRLMAMETRGFILLQFLQTWDCWS